MLSARRDKAAARRFFEQAIERNGAPEKVTIDKSGSNVAALEAITAGPGMPIVVRQVKYLNNIVEQDRSPIKRAIKRRTRPMLGFKNFRCACILVSGIELMHMIRKGQTENGGSEQPPRPAFLLLGSIRRTTVAAFDCSSILSATEPLRTAAGRAVYKMRKAIVEPVFGQIKEQRGFRRFSLRGKDKVSREWKLVCAVSNLLKLFRAGLVPQRA